MTESISRVPLAEDLEAEVSALVDNVERDWAADPSGVGRIAAQLGALPLLLDAGGFMAIKRDGTVVRVAWDAPLIENPVLTSRHRDLALIAGARRYRALNVLCPQRTESSQTCPYCLGRGVAPGVGEGMTSRIVCWCGGHGWTPATWTE